MTRSSLLPVLALMMMFGMFSLRPGQAGRLTWFTLALFGVTMRGSHTPFRKSSTRAWKSFTS